MGRKITKQHEKTERLHALDSLRAVIMLLGLVFHSALTYKTIENSEMWGLQDPESTHMFFDLLVAYIHSFRIPLFFVIAGFFGALLFYERSLKEMVKNRLNRVVYPFVIFSVFLWPLVSMAWRLTGAAIRGQDISLLQFWNILINTPLLPANTMHLWFLYHLILYSMAGALIGWVLTKTEGAGEKIQYGYELLMHSVVARLMVFAAITFVYLYIDDTLWIEKTNSLLPAWNAVGFYFLFYLFGWFLYGSKHMIDSFMCWDWLMVLSASTGVVVKVFYSTYLDDRVIMAINALNAWLFIFGIIGLFIHYLGARSSSMRRIADASYWFYLIHLPLTILIPGLLIGSGWMVGIKYLVVLGGAVSVCWVTYWCFVRRSWIGVLLNGRIKAKH